MQIKGRRWNMRQSRRRASPFKIIFLAALAAFLVYVNRTIEPLSPHLFLPSPTPTISADVFLAQAEEMAKDGKYTQALANYQNAIRADPQNPALYIATARLYAYSGRYEEAVDSASNAVLLNPKSSMGEALKGLSHGMMGEYLAAETSLNRSIELEPGNAITYAYLSIVLSQKIYMGQQTLGDLDRAIEASRTAESIAPGSLESFWARGMVLEITGNYEEAVIELEQAVAINAYIADLHITLGRNYRFLGRNDLAVESFTKANALNPADPNPDLLISRTYANIGEFGKAIQYAEQAVADQPENPFLYGNLGVMYRQNFEASKALLTLKLAVQGGLTPEGVVVQGLPLSYANRVPEFYYNYGFALEELSYCREAVDIAQAILQSIGNDDIAVNNASVILDRCYKKMNDLQMLKLPAPTMLPTWTPRPSATPTPMTTAEPAASVSQ
jgi:tetratricopeptide (TPR) repeat protein